MRSFLFDNFGLIELKIYYFCMYNLSSSQIFIIGNSLQESKFKLDQIIDWFIIFEILERMI